MIKDICIIPSDMMAGGPAAFRTKLSDGLNKHGLMVKGSIHDAGIDSILVINSTKDIVSLLKQKKRGVRVVQRLGMPWRYSLIKPIMPYNHVIKAMLINVLMEFIRRFVADHIIYQSEYVKDQWERIFGKIETGSSIIHNGIDLEKFCPDGGYHESNADICIISVEGNQGNDPHNISLNICKNLKKQGYNVELLVLGNMANKMRNCYRQYPFVNILGHIPNDDLPYYYRGADCYVFTDYITAGCPNSVIEALACGTPVVACNQGVITEILDKESGVLAEGYSEKNGPSDFNVLADAVLKVSSCPERYHAGARKRAEAMFNLEEMVVKYLNVIRS